jgi:Na+/H+-dicarboxylate symporter
LIAIAIGVVFGLSGIELLISIGKCCAEIFARILKCVGIPIVSLSVIVALSSYGSDNKSMVAILKKSWLYTLTTTVVAASIAALLYYIISPGNVTKADAISPTLPTSYSKIVMDIVPDSILKSFLNHNVLSVLLISAVIGVSIGFIKETNAKKTIILFFKGMQDIFFVIVKFIVKIIPIGLFGFIVLSIQEFKDEESLFSMGKYFFVIVIANLLQGTIVLPLLLIIKGLKPLKVFKAMLPAVSLAFFSKSSSVTLPVTINTIEKNLEVDPKISRFVLPLCTTINMNACAAFIFVTSIYMMQNHGIEITVLTMLSWIFISTLAAIGNAGVPMGCYFMTVSLLSAMDIPIALMGIVLPICNIIDTIETAINVWSDSCITTVINKEIKNTPSITKT